MGSAAPAAVSAVKNFWAQSYAEHDVCHSNSCSESRWALQYSPYCFQTMCQHVPGAHAGGNMAKQVELDQLCLHTCTIVGAGGSFWPAPTFRIEATDRTQSIIEAKSPTGAWNAVLQRINLEIERRCVLSQSAGKPWLDDRQ